jgi:uncharacterized membrane protein YccC
VLTSKVVATTANDRDPASPSLLGRVGRDLTQFNRAATAPLDTVRTTAAVVAVLAAGVATGHALEGVDAAIGALSTGFASLQGFHRSRLAATATAALGMAVSTFVGALTSGHAVAAVIAVAIWGAAAGLSVALGQAAGVVTLQWVVALIVVGAFRADPAQAAARAGFVLAGGGLQVVLLALTLPFGDRQQERQALAAALRSLATFAGSTAAGGSDLPDTSTLSQARAVLADPQPFRSPAGVSTLTRMVDETDRARLSLIALRRLRSLLPADRVRQLDIASAAAAPILAELAVSLRAGRPVALPGQTWEEWEAAERAMGTPGSRRGDPTANLWDDAGARTRALGGQLRTLVRLRRELDDTRGPALAGTRAPAPVLPLREAARTLRANLTRRSPAGRHALRMAVLLAACVAFNHAVVIAHGYWLGLTALVVLRPDFLSTVTRAGARVTGTLAGGAAATLVAALIRPGPGPLVILVGVCALGAYTLIQVNYAVFAAFLTALVAFLVAFTGLPAVTAVGYRSGFTIAGGLLALAAYALWPTWEATLAPDALARLLDAQSGYLAAVLSAYADPAARDRDRLRALREQARLARSTAEASADRLAVEPHRVEARLGGSVQGILAAARSIATAGLTLHARLPAAAATPRPELGRLITEVTQSFAGLAEALRTRTAPPRLPDLRACHTDLSEHWRTGAAEGNAAVDAALLDTETDLLVDSLDTIEALLAGTGVDEVGAL